MPDPSRQAAGAEITVERLSGLLEKALAKLERTSGFAKAGVRGPVLDSACRLLARPGGPALVAPLAPRLTEAGVFAGTDWEHPERLVPPLAAGTLVHGDRTTATLEMVNELRMLALVRGEASHPGISSEQARHYLAQVLALSIDRLIGAPGEAERARGTAGVAAGNVLGFVAERIGYGSIVDEVVGEIERILAQRPILVESVKEMITRLSVALHEGDLGTEGPGPGAERIIAALYGPTPLSRGDPGIEVYANELANLPDDALREEAKTFARSMHETGLVSPYHPVLVRFLDRSRPDLVGPALGLSSTGTEALACYRELVTKLVDAAVAPDTAQAVYGLALVLERGLLFDPAVGPALWCQFDLGLAPAVERALVASFGDRVPAAKVLLAGTLSVLGQPLGVGQGNNPTCQAARAISMWALTAPDYLLHLLTRAARDDEIVMFFEGREIRSGRLKAGMANGRPPDVDPVSTVLVPHLDRIYMEMGRLCADRGSDPHAWINREMHGWWVGRETALAVDPATGRLVDFGGFVRRFYALYHPLYNGNRPVIHPQPAGVAVTDGLGRFVGWHAITILRVGMSPKGLVRVYFFNPNNDSGQDWSRGVVVSTEGRGERHGESSLPIDEFASRLYLFHYDPFDEGDLPAVPAAEVAGVESMARATWAATRA